MLISKTIEGAHKILGLINSGESVSQDELNDGLEAFNGLIEQLALNPLAIINKVDREYSEPSGGWTRKITIGYNGDIDEAPPISVESIYFKCDDGLNYPVLEVSKEQMVTMQNNVNETGKPSYCVITQGNRSITIEFDRIPEANSTLHIYGNIPYTSDGKYEIDFQLTDDVTYAFGVEVMLRYQLALILAPMYGVDINPLVLKRADELMEQVKTNNAKIPVLKCENEIIRKRKLNNNTRYY